MILTADWHLTEKDNDLYRFAIFKTLKKVALRYEGNDLVIIGDITDQKDKHSSLLVNKIVQEFKGLSECFQKIVIVAGNHDYIDPKNPFFRFLDVLDNVQVVYGEPAEKILLDGNKIVKAIPALPHYEEYPVEFLEKTADYLLLHQAIKGSVAANGQILDGLPAKVLKDAGWAVGEVFAGDIHVPQKVSPAIYTGAPHHTRFGDTYKSRVLVVEDKTKIKSIPIKNTQKIKAMVDSVEDLAEMELVEGDHVKVYLSLSVEDYVNWATYKEEIEAICADKKVVLFGVEVVPLDNKEDVLEEVSIEDVFLDYCSREGVDEYTIGIGQQYV